LSIYMEIESMCWRRPYSSSKMVCETNTAVKTEMKRPMISVTAKPLTGPVPNWNRNIAETIVVTWVSMIVANALENPFSMAAFGAAPVGRPAGDGLEKRPVGVARHAEGQDEAGDARQRQRRLEERHGRREQHRVQDERDDGVPAGPPVVDGHRHE